MGGSWTTVKLTEGPVRENEGSFPALKPKDEDVGKLMGQEKVELSNSSKHVENAFIDAALTQLPVETTHSPISISRDLRLTTLNKCRQSHILLSRSIKRPEESLLLAVSEELKDLERHTLKRIEEDITGLDTSHNGTIHQSELTYLFLKWQVPLRLPTLASLIKIFSSSTNPEQVLYKELLQFIQKQIRNQELQNTEADIWKASSDLGHGNDVDSEWSKDVLSSVDPGDTETWLQRFKKMESSLCLCDSQNTDRYRFWSSSEDQGGRESARSLLRNESESDLEPVERFIRELRGDSEMTVEQTGTSGFTYKSYKDAAIANLPPNFYKQPPVNPARLQLISSLKDLLARHPEGLTLNQARRSCPLLLNPDVLKDYPSVRHLLQSMPNVVRLEGVGVQIRILPPVAER